MKLLLTCLALAMVCSVAPLRGQEGQDVILPSSRKTVPVADLERNPFAKVEQPKVEAPVEATDAKSEESRIETLLESLPVVGRTRGPAGWKVLLGDLILETGTTLPPVIDGQTQKLRVAAIYDSMIEIEWVVNKAPKDPKTAHEVPKRIFVVVQLNPTVATALSGQVPLMKKGSQPLVLTQPENAAPPPPDALHEPK